MNENNLNIPNEYRPLSPWGYIGYNVLFSIPIIGLILMIVFALDDSYIARRNYARSYLWALLIGILITVLITILFTILGVSLKNLNY